MIMIDLDVIFNAALMQPQSEMAVIQWVVMTTHVLLQVYDYFTFNIDVFKGQIQAYDPQKFNVGIAKESGLVPLLLAPIWLLFPYLQVSLNVQFEITNPYYLMRRSYIDYSRTCSSASKWPSTCKAQKVWTFACTAASMTVINVGMAS